MKTTYKVTYTRDEEGWWVATVPSIEGCHTQGKTIAIARERIVECIKLCLDTDAPAGFQETVSIGESKP